MSHTLTDEQCAELNVTLDPEVQRVIREMATCDDELRPYVRTLAADLDMPVERLRQILRRLGEHGLATYGVVHDRDDGRPMGSTWWLTEKGKRVQELLDNA